MGYGVRGTGSSPPRFLLRCGAPTPIHVPRPPHGITQGPENISPTVRGTYQPIAAGIQWAAHIANYQSRRHRGNPRAPASQRIVVRRCGFGHAPRPPTLAGAEDYHGVADFGIRDVRSPLLCRLRWLIQSATVGEMVFGTLCNTCGVEVHVFGVAPTAQEKSRWDDPYPATRNPSRPLEHVRSCP